SRDPCGGYLAQPAVCSRRAQGSALPGPWSHAGAEHALNGASAGLPQKGPPAANTQKITVRAVAEIITLWPRQERLSNSRKINGRSCPHCMGFLATLCRGSSWRHTERNSSNSIECS